MNCGVQTDPVPESDEGEITVDNVPISEVKVSEKYLLTSLDINMISRAKFQ